LGRKTGLLDTKKKPAKLPYSTIRTGETYSIAATYKTTVAALKRNNGNVLVFRPGMIWSSSRAG
jgi:LysM repeat protein